MCDAETNTETTSGAVGLVKWLRKSSGLNDIYVNNSSDCDDCDDNDSAIHNKLAKKKRYFLFA